MYVNKRMSSRNRIYGTIPPAGDIFIPVPEDAQAPFTVHATGPVYISFDDGTTLFGVPVTLGTQDALAITVINNNAKVIAISGTAGDSYSVLF